MKSIFNLILVAIVALAGFINTARADDNPVPDVYRYQGTFTKQRYLMVDLSSVFGGPGLNLMIPPADPKARYAPSQDVLDQLKDLKTGDLVKVIHTKVSSMDAISTIEKYDLQPGEDQPGVYVFDEVGAKKIGVTEYEYALVRHIGNPMQALLPKIKNARGEMDDDPNLERALKEFKKGDLVTVTLKQQGSLNFLQSMEAYKPPLKGVFVKATEVQDGGVAKPAVEVKIDGASQTLLLPGTTRNGKWVADAQLSVLIARLKEGQPVEISTKQDGDQAYLKDLRVLPKVAEKKGGGAGG